MKRTLTRASLLALSIGVASMVTTAPALAKDPEIYFYPQQAWTLAAADNGACSVQSRFNNGFVMRMHGSEAWIENIQIDFQQPSFENGKTYPITISVPGIQQQTVTGTAANPSLLSLDMAGKKELYKAIRNSSVFDFTIDKNQFRFYMVGFASKAVEFERCMAGASKIQQAQAQNDDGSLVANKKTIGSGPADPTMNEAIYFEKAEKEGTNITEVLPQHPPPVSAAGTTPEGSVAAPVAAVSAVTPLAQTNIEPPKALAKPAPARRRLSSMLADQIAANPEIAEIEPEHPRPLREAMDNAAAAAQTAEDQVQERKGLIIPKEPQMVPLPTPVETPRVIKNKPMAAPAEAQLAEKVIDEVPALPPRTEQAAPVAPESMKAPDIEVPEIRKAPPVNTPDMRLADKAPAPTHYQPPAAQAITPEPMNSIPVRSAPPVMDVPAMEALPPRISEESRRAAAKLDMVQSEALKLKQEIVRLEQENHMLNEELKLSLSEGRQEHVQISSENWNLERATMRYQEAERQLQRLGQQLQQERARCDVEKRDLEAMLFDPQVTSAQQLAKLAELERQLADMKHQMDTQRQRYEERIRLLEQYAKTP